MTANEVRLLLRSHWAFRVFDRFPKRHYALVGLVISAAIAVLGALIAALVGGLAAYASGLLPYLYGLGFALVFFSYGWWRDRLAQMLVTLYPAFDTTEAAYQRLITTWDKSWFNQFWAGVVFGLPIALLNFHDLPGIWAVKDLLTTDRPIETLVWGPWVHGSPALFFQIWYGVLHVALEGFFLGSGLAGLIATVVLLSWVLQKDLRLAYYRLLDAAIALGTQLAFWILIALTAVALLSRPTTLSIAARLSASPTPAPAASATPATGTPAPTTTAPTPSGDDGRSFLILSTIFQSALAGVALAVVFGLPFVMCHNAIEQAKAAYSLHLRRAAERAYQNIQALADKVAHAEGGAQAANSEQFEALQKQLDTVNALIKDVDELPSWPISWSARLQLIGGFGASALSPFVLDWLSRLLRALLPSGTPAP